MQVKPRVAVAALEDGDDRFGSGVTVGMTHRRNRRVGHIESRLDRLDDRRSAHPRRGMRVQSNGHRRGLLKAGHHFAGHVRLEQAGHVLDADGMAPHVLELLAHVDPGLHRVDGTDRVGDCALGVLAGLERGLDRRLDVPHVVQGVKDAEHVHPVLGRFAHERLNDVVSIVPVSEQVLPTEQHLRPRIGQSLAELPQPFPGVFAEEPDTGIERRPAPHFCRP